MAGVQSGSDPQWGGSHSLHLVGSLPLSPRVSLAEMLLQVSLVEILLLRLRLMGLLISTLCQIVHKSSSPSLSRLPGGYYRLGML